MSLHQYIIQFGAGQLGGEVVDAPESVDLQEEIENPICELDCF